ncbi:MAG: hypothetical protein JST87_19050 [Bacteroidetes bacterium]|nr:hypothetical protein [Bacteroidota bacterium]
MKKFILISIVVAAVVACNKTTTLPTYTPPVSKNLVVKTFAHTADTVNVGDTIYLTATGTVYDSLNLYGYFSISSSSTGSPVYTVGSSSSPIKLATALATKNPTDTNSFVATIVLPKLTNVSGSKLTVTGNFVYPLSLSSQGANIVTGVADAGQLTKTIYIQ